MRKSTRVYRYSRYAEWLQDRFGSSLVRGWDGDDPPGASAFQEVTGSGDDATISGTYEVQQPSVVRGLRGAPRTDGSTATSDAGDIGAMDVGSSDSFTVICWLTDLPESDGDNSTLLGKRDGASGAGWRLLLIDFSGVFFCRLNTSDGTDTENADSNTRSQSEMNESPRMFGGVVDRSNDTSHAYVDGVSEGSADISAVGDLSNGIGVTVWSGQSNVYRAQHTYFFDRALTSDEMSDLYERGMGLGL